MKSIHISLPFTIYLRDKAQGKIQIKLYPSLYIYLKKLNP